MHKSYLFCFGIVLVSALVIAVIFTACKSDTNAASDDSDGAVLQFDSFDGGGPTYSVSVSDPSVLSYSSEQKYAKENHEELDGASYKVIYTFRGIQSGETTVTVSARSPIGDNYDSEYKAVVDKNLHVTLTQTKTSDLDSDPVEPVPTLVMTVNDKTLYPWIADTPAADALIEKLSQEELELELHNNGEFEITGDLPWTLPQNDEMINAQPGDILLLNGNQLCLSLGETELNCTRLASLQDMTQESLSDIFGTGNVTIHLWVEWSE